MRKLVKPVVLIAVGIVIAFPLFSLTYYTMVRTTTPQFCATCHEIQFAYNTWKTSSHVKKDYDHESNRQKAYASFKNDQCQKCHRNLLYIPNKRGAMLAHRDVVYARPGYEKRCVDCHRNLVHNSRELYDYKQYKDTYRGLGL